MHPDHAAADRAAARPPASVTAPGRLTVAARFNGPAGSANGGYTAGRLAAYVGSSYVGMPDVGTPDARGTAVTVTLRQPPPLDAPMKILPTPGGGVRAMFGGGLIAEAGPGDLDVDPVDPVPYDVATGLASRYAGWDRHPFPGCFVCGPQRPPPDGLGLRPGRLPDRPDCTAAAWIPEPDLAGAAGGVPEELVWAALDCPGGWTLDLVGRPAVLGRMTAEVDALPHVGDRCVVMGRALGGEGRKALTATTLYDGDGRVLGRAHAVWVTVDRATAGRRPPA